MTSATRKKVGTKVKVTPRPVKAGAVNKRMGKRRPKNSPVRLIHTDFRFTAGTLQGYLYAGLIGIFRRDPTMIMGRTDLVNLLMKRCQRRANQVGPFISDCIFKHGILKYQGE